MLFHNPTIGKQIAYYRKKRKLKQKEVAAILGIPHRYLSDIETGRKYPKINLLAMLADVLGVSIDELNGL